MTRKKLRCLRPLLLVVSLFVLFYVVWHIVLWDFFPRNRPADFDVSLLKKLHYIQKLTPQDIIEPLKRYGYNIVKSHDIQPHRSVIDTRHISCRLNDAAVAERFPPTSIVITFQEIDRSVLLRNIVSILTKSSPVVIHEIIIVDDGSTNEDGKLLSQLPGLKIIRNKQSQGRGVARTQGAAVATGEVIVFVDGLTEVNVDWLSPLLRRLKESPKSLVSPVLDSIDYMSFDYVPASSLVRGGFDWSLHYHWEDVPIRYHARESPMSPLRSPVLSGIVVAVTKDFFHWLGKYDSNPVARDTEDLELSLRAWLCGGQVEIVPCSKVGVIQFKGEQLGVLPVSFSSYIKSARRLAEVWLDDYKRFFYALRPSARMQPITNITSQRKLKQRLKCRHFKWFLVYIYPQLQPLINDEFAYGHIQQGNNCIDMDPGQLPIVAKLRTCAEDKDSQEWSWRKKGLILSGGMCLTSDLMTMQRFVVAQFCTDLESQFWYRHNEKIVHQDTNLCLDGLKGNTGLLITDCIKDRQSQSWTISTEEQPMNNEQPNILNDEDHDDIHDSQL